MPNLHIEIVINANMNREWAEWFGGLRVEPAENDSTRISGEIPDQSALHGLLERIRDLNLPLVSVHSKPTPLKGN